jgi:Zn-dependent peptidase ImmA (M78 family)
MCPALAELRDKQPYEQGYSLAAEARRAFRLGDEERVEPKDILQELGVSVREVSLTYSVDAVGCWGPQHGPAVILNTRGKHASTPHGRRATLAHELCHLLVDRDNALPLAEVLGGRFTQRRAEQRANAFAAELLLPRWVARETYKQRPALDPTIDELCSRFGVGVTLTANQLLAADRSRLLGLTAKETRFLKGLREVEDYE